MAVVDPINTILFIFILYNFEIMKQLFVNASSSYINSIKIP